LFKPSSVMPVAYNIAWEAPCDLGCVIVRETLFRSLSSFCEARKEDVDDKARLNNIRNCSHRVAGHLHIL